jgi:hypothetical protein
LESCIQNYKLNSVCTDFGSYSLKKSSRFFFETFGRNSPRRPDKRVKEKPAKLPKESTGPHWAGGPTSHCLVREGLRGMERSTKRTAAHTQHRCPNVAAFTSFFLPCVHLFPGGGGPACNDALRLAIAGRGPLQRRAPFPPGTPSSSLRLLLCERVCTLNPNTSYLYSDLTQSSRTYVYYSMFDTGSAPGREGGRKQQLLRALQNLGY